MKMKVCSVAFAMLLSTTTLLADSTNVTFDAALTNATGWAYSNDVKISADSDKHIFFNTLRSFIQSPEYPFIITSIEITLSCSNTNATRRLQVSPSTGASLQTANVTSKDKKEVQSFLFDMADCVRSFNISLEGSGQTGNWHIYSAAIFGVPLIEPPTNLQSDEIKGTRSNLSWENPENAVSNKIEVAEIAWHEEGGSVEREYNFDEFSNGGDKGQQTEKILAAYPDLEGFVLCLPTNSTGQIQLSNSGSKGVLSFPGFESCNNLYLKLLAKHYNHADEATFVSIGFVQDKTTNDFTTVELTTELTMSFTSLTNVPPNARIVINNSGKATNHRVIIDHLAFIRDYSPASVSTNLVKTVFATGNTSTIRGLSPNSTYVVSVSAFDEDGNESTPSEPIPFMTNSEELPFVIRLQ